MNPSLNDLLCALLPERGARGMVAMLEYYLDDSGTHGESRVAVWGGIFGHKQFVEELDSAWRVQLQHPCEGRPPIKVFSSADLASSNGEFRDYTQAERDLTRYNFRKVILDAGLTILSFGISVRDWDEIMSGRARTLLGSAERMIFGLAVRYGCDAAKSNGMPISFMFDRGRRHAALDSIIQPAIEAAEAENEFVSHGFAPVSGIAALQAADMVAHQTYQFLTEYIDDPSAEPHPHLRRLFEGAHDAKTAWLGKAEIQQMTPQIQGLFQMMDATVDDQKK